MTENLFMFDRRNFRDCQQAYRGVNNQEYYLGDYRIEAGSVIDVRADRKAVGACSIIQLQSRTRMSFTRNWRHIRDDATDVTVFWFVRSGRLKISHANGTALAGEGEFAVTTSMVPFAIDCETNAQGRHEVLHLTVPTHDFRQHSPGEFKPILTLDEETRPFRIAREILKELFDDPGELSGRVQQQLLDSVLVLMADEIRGDADCALVRQSLPDQRLQDVLRFIELHLSDANLSTAMVSESCGLSQRYLSFLLKQNGTPFSTLVWEKRLKIARRWLAESRPNEISIAEIAFRVGFKSPAHFSRMFKRVYKQGPREYRNTVSRKTPGVEARPHEHTGHTTLQ